MNMKRILIVGLVVAVMLIGGITAGTQLLIDQPATAQVRIADIGGGSPTFNVIDNASTTTAGGKSGHIDGDDYVIDFDDLIFGKNQDVTVGSSDDPVFTLENNYAKGLVIRIWGDCDCPFTGYPSGYDSYHFYLQMRGGQLYSSCHPKLWIHDYCQVNITGWAFGSDWLPAGESFDYYWWFNGTVAPPGGYNCSLKLIASENDEPLEVWALANLPPNDCVFDHLNQLVYHKLADGSDVEIIPMDTFDYDAWFESISKT